MNPTGWRLPFLAMKHWSVFRFCVWSFSLIESSVTRATNRIMEEILRARVLFARKRRGIRKEFNIVIQQADLDIFYFDPSFDTLLLHFSLDQPRKKRLHQIINMVPVAAQIIVALVGVIVVAKVFSWWDNRSSEKQEEGRTYPHSNPRNNHDDRKHKHASAESAEAEVKRMQRNDYEDSDRLTVYYNQQLNGFFVGKRQRRFDF